MSGSLKKIGYGVALFLIAAISLAHLAYYFPRTVDDFFIYLRYAENFATGSGLVYNVPERIEGFSCLPWVMMQSLAFLLGVNAVTFTKILGALFFLSLIAAAMLIALEITEKSRGLALLAGLLFALNSYIASWSVLGLETPFFLSALLWTVYALMKFEDAPGWGRGAALVLAAFLFSISRPEAPMYLALIFLSALLAPRGGLGFVKKLKAGSPVVAVVAVVAALFACFIMGRYLYYGEILPHVYHAKPLSGLSPLNLGPLVTRGACTAEIVFVVGGLALSALFWVNRKIAPLTAAVVSCLLFVILVEEDWMPNMRFFLPLYASLTLVWIHALGWCISKISTKAVFVVLAVIIDVALAFYALETARVESKYMAAEFSTYGGGENWKKAKSLDAVENTRLAFKRVIPDHITDQPIDTLGMTHQLFDVLEASAAPLEESWFIGRNFGNVGYFAPVKVFDTDGLFTPAISRNEQWKQKGTVSPSLIKHAFSLRPIATELLKDWSLAAMKSKSIMADFEIFRGSKVLPKHLRPRIRELPSMEVILKRYEEAMEKFPCRYYILSLHGESVGAAMDRRYDYIQSVIEDHDPLVAGAIDSTALLGDALFPLAGLSTYGCKITPQKVKAGKEITTMCCFKRTREVKYTYQLFLHFEGPGRFQGDHFPIGGLVPTNYWPEGIVCDMFRMKVPKTASPGTYKLFFGLHTWMKRENVSPAKATDGNNRIIGPELEIM